MEYSDKELISLIIKQVEEINKEKGLITNNFKHLDYERGASMYVSKYICNENTNYNYIESK